MRPLTVLLVVLVAGASSAAAAAPGAPKGHGSRFALKAEKKALTKLLRRKHPGRRLVQIRVSRHDDRWAGLRTAPKGRRAAAARVKVITAHRASTRSERWKDDAKPPHDVAEDLRKVPKPTVSYVVSFPGHGTFSSTWKYAVDTTANDACRHTIITFKETDTLAWDSLYPTVNVPRNPSAKDPFTEFVLETGVPLQGRPAGTWKARSVADPPQCLGSSRSCSGTLVPRQPTRFADPSATDDIFWKGFYDKGVWGMYVDHVPTFSVGKDATGDSSCRLDRGAEACSPWTAGTFEKNLVREAMQGFTRVSRTKLLAGKAFSIPMEDR